MDSEVQPLPLGQNTHSVRLGSLIVRRARHKEAAASLRRESQVLPILRPWLPAPIPTPRMVEIEDDVMAAHLALPGEPLLSVQNLSDSACDQLAQFLGRFLFSLHHQVPVEPLWAMNIPHADSIWWDEFTFKIESRIFTSLDAPQREAVQAAFAAHLERLPILPVTLIHGDFGIGNILWDGVTITGIIDFGSMQWADPAWDIAGINASFGSTFTRRMKSTYPQTEEFLERSEFYRLVFALLEALHGAEHDTPEILEAGICGVSRILSL